MKLTGSTPFVVDFKTSKAIQRSHELQLSSYRETLENGENPLFEKNANGTESNKMIDLSGLRTAILQVGYERNKAGYKFTESRTRSSSSRSRSRYGRRRSETTRRGSPSETSRSSYRQP